MTLGFLIANLDNLKYGQLQRLAKRHSIKANQKAALLIASLKRLAAKATNEVRVESNTPLRDEKADPTSCEPEDPRAHEVVKHFGEAQTETVDLQSPKIFTPSASADVTKCPNVAPPPIDSTEEPGVLVEVQDHACDDLACEPLANRRTTFSLEKSTQPNTPTILKSRRSEFTQLELARASTEFLNLINSVSQPNLLQSSESATSPAPDNQSATSPAPDNQSATSPAPDNQSASKSSLADQPGVVIPAKTHPHPASPPMEVECSPAKELMDSERLDNSGRIISRRSTYDLDESSVLLPLNSQSLGVSPELQAMGETQATAETQMQREIMKRAESETNRQIESAEVKGAVDLNETADVEPAPTAIDRRSTYRLNNSVPDVASSTASEGDWLENLQKQLDQAVKDNAQQIEDKVAEKMSRFLKNGADNSQNKPNSRTPNFKRLHDKHFSKMADITTIVERRKKMATACRAPFSKTPSSKASSAASRQGEAVRSAGPKIVKPIRGGQPVSQRPKRAITDHPSSKPPHPVQKSPSRLPLRNQKTPSRPITNQKTPSRPITNQKTPSRPITNQKTPSCPATNTKTPSRPVTNVKAPSQPVTHQRSPSRPITSQRSPSRPIANPASSSGQSSKLASASGVKRQLTGGLTSRVYSPTTSTLLKSKAEPLNLPITGERSPARPIGQGHVTSGLFTVGSKPRGPAPSATPGSTAQSTRPPLKSLNRKLEAKPAWQPKIGIARSNRTSELRRKAALTANQKNRKQVNMANRDLR